MFLFATRYRLYIGAILAFSTTFALPLSGRCAVGPQDDAACEKTFQTWIADAFAKPQAVSAGHKSSIPFSFTYNNRQSQDLLPHWQYSSQGKATPFGRQEKIAYQDPKTGLLIECELTRYDDCHAVDWVLYLTNTGTADTPIIENILPLDSERLLDSTSDPIVLRWSNGDRCSVDSFLPHDEPLKPAQSRRFAPAGGRSSNTTAFPFFNLCSPHGGWILAIGWTGQWQAEFIRDAQGRLTIRAGMESTHFRLRPGQRVRTPRIVLLHYPDPEMIAGHNRFRRLMLAHYVQRRDGRPAAPPICHNTAGTIYRSNQRATEANQLAIIEKAAQLGVEAYWMDAYWYPQGWVENAGNWFPRPGDFPRGLRPLGDAAHRHGMKFVLWFEPERVFRNTQFAREHPEFLLKLKDADSRLFNLGDPNARKFLTDFLDEKIKQWGVDVYRQDFNFDPLPYWNEHDAKDRRGIAEMLYVEGLYRFWADLMKRNPGLTIDNCASGGRRIDIETCSLAYPLWRSDFNDIGEGLKGPKHWPNMACADQVHVSGLALYIPFQAGPLWDMHPYCVRSAMTSSVVLYERIQHKDFPAELAKQAIAEIKRLRPLFEGDFYPLLPITTNQADWHAYQLDRPDLKQGCALVFRRPESNLQQRDIHLHGIDPEADYMVNITGETYDKSPARRMQGRELMPLKVRINTQPGSVLVEYTRVGP
jgi:alpha-galactosidase